MLDGLNQMLNFFYLELHELTSTSASISTLTHKAMALCLQVNSQILEQKQLAFHWRNTLLGIFIDT